MAAFGDLSLFVSIFFVTALIPSGLGLCFLRAYRPFWIAISGLGITIALTGLVAAILVAISNHLVAPAVLGDWAALSVLRILAAPLFAITFLASALLSPYRIPRLALLTAFSFEIAVSAYGGFYWVVHVILGRP